MSSSRKSLRRKPLWRWEPTGYIVLFLLIIVTSALQVMGASVAFWMLLGLTAVVALALVGGIVVGVVRGPGNPDAVGNLSTLSGLVMLPGTRTVEAPTVVFDTKRHQSAIDAAAAFGRAGLSAVLVPGATRWLGRRLRVAVQLVAGERVFHAGFLAPEEDAEWNELLFPLRAENAYVQIPAVVRGANRPYTVEVDLRSARAAIATANSQSAPR